FHRGSDRQRCRSLRNVSPRARPTIEQAQTSNRQSSKRFRLKLEGPISDRDELLEECNNFLAASIVPGEIRLARLMPTDLVREERTDRIPVTPCTCLIKIADRPFLRVHQVDLTAGGSFTS